MIKTVRKGYRIEKACEDELKTEGYFTWKTIRVQYQNIDLFGLLSLLIFMSMSWIAPPMWATYDFFSLSLAPQ